MEFSKLVKERYACRKYSSRRVEKETLYKIISEALNAPSAKNTQPWEFFVASEKDEADKIRECLQDDGKNGFLSAAPSFIAVFENTPANIACPKYDNERFVKYDVGEIVAYLTLSAKNAGLDTCIIGWINEERLKINVGVNKPCGIVVAVGYAADGAQTIEKKRIDIKEKIINYKEN